MRLTEERRRLLEEEDYAGEAELREAFEPLRREAEVIHRKLTRAQEISLADSLRQNPPPWPTLYQEERARVEVDADFQRHQAMLEYDRENPKPDDTFLNRMSGKLEGWEKAREEKLALEDKKFEETLKAFEKEKEAKRQENKKKYEKDFREKGFTDEKAKNANRYLEENKDRAKKIGWVSVDEISEKPTRSPTRTHNMSDAMDKEAFLKEREARVCYMETLKGRVDTLSDFVKERDVQALKGKDTHASYMESLRRNADNMPEFAGIKAKIYDDRSAANLENALKQEEKYKNEYKELVEDHPEPEDAMDYYREQKSVPVHNIQGLRNHKENDNRDDPCAIADGLDCLKHQRAAMSREDNQKYGKRDEDCEFLLRYKMEEKEARLDRARETYERNGNKLSDAQRVMERQFEKDHFEAEFGKKLWNRVAEREKEMFGETATYRAARVKEEACEKAVGDLDKRLDEIRKGVNIPEDIYVHDYRPKGGPPVRANGFRDDQRSEFAKPYDEQDKEKRYQSSFVPSRRALDEMTSRASEAQQDRKTEGKEKGDGDDQTDDDPEAKRKR